MDEAWLNEELRKGLRAWGLDLQEEYAAMEQAKLARARRTVGRARTILRADRLGCDPREVLKRLKRLLEEAK